MDDRVAFEAWINARVDPVGIIELASEEPWSTVLRVPLAEGVAWFKACAPAWAFEPRLTAELYARWPDRVAEVLGYDEERPWLLLADAGRSIYELGNPLEPWLSALPLYAELQRGEAARASEHLEHGVPDMRVTSLPERYDDFLRHDLPLESDEIARLRTFAPRFAELCAELAASGVAETVQHDDLHMWNVYAHSDRLRVLDWGDASISHPFASLVCTFRHIEFVNQLAPADPWFARLRDAYLEPWGPGLTEVCALAIRVGRFAYAFAHTRQRDNQAPDEPPGFDEDYLLVLQEALAATHE